MLLQKFLCTRWTAHLASTDDWHPICHRGGMLFTFVTVPESLPRAHLPDEQLTSRPKKGNPYDHIVHRLL